MSKRYDDPVYGVDHTVSLGKVGSNAAAATVMAYFSPFAACKIKEVQAVIHAAGTAATMGWGIYKGTTSIGSLTAGTNAAASVLTATLADTDFAATDYLALKNIGTDTQLEGWITIQFQEKFSS